MDSKEALMKGLKGINRDEFLDAVKLCVEEQGNENNTLYKDDDQLKIKYPVYNEALELIMTSIKSNQGEKAVLHAIGILSALRILIHLSEKQN